MRPNWLYGPPYVDLAENQRVIRAVEIDKTTLADVMRIAREHDPLAYFELFDHDQPTSVMSTPRKVTDQWVMSDEASSYQLRGLRLMGPNVSIEFGARQRPNIIFGPNESGLGTDQHKRVGDLLLNECRHRPQWRLRLVPKLPAVVILLLVAAVGWGVASNWPGWPVLVASVLVTAVLALFVWDAGRRYLSPESWTPQRQSGYLAFQRGHKIVSNSRRDILDRRHERNANIRAAAVGSGITAVIGVALYLAGLKA